MKLKSLVVFTLLVTSNFYCNAQNKVPGVIVELANGQKVEYRLVDKPKLVYDGSKITLTAEGVVVEYTPSNLKKVMTGEVENVPSGIEEYATPQSDIRIDAGFIRLSGFKANEDVRVYSVTGNIIASYSTNADGTLVIPISSMPSGISIIKANKQSIKITKQ